MNPMMLMLNFSLIVATLLMVAAKLLSKKNKNYKEKLSPFECGFDPLKKARAPFSFRFFLVSIIFLVFDVEIILLMPLALIQTETSSITVPILMQIILVVLIIGLMNEWDQGCLQWNS